MTIALIIMGLVGTLSFPLITKYIEYSKWEKTDKHQELILQSLKSYLFMHHHLPCPADPLKPGIAKTMCQEPQHSVGIIPYRTLSLPLSSVKDGFNHFMTYAVNPYLTNSQGQNFCQDQEPVIGVFSKIKNKAESVFEPEKPRQAATKTASDVIAFVIVSYGPKGIGSFKTEDAIEEIVSSSSTSISLQEKQNINPIQSGNLDSMATTNSETKFPIMFYSQSYSTNPDQLFRHKIVWETQKFFGGFCQKQKLKEVMTSVQSSAKPNHNESPDLKIPPVNSPQNSTQHNQNSMADNDGLNNSARKDLPSQNSDSIPNGHGLNHFSRKNSSKKSTAS